MASPATIEAHSSLQLLFTSTRSIYKRWADGIAGND
jgi:hypothetical protein